jgi:hypothetical protein
MKKIALTIVISAFASTAFAGGAKTSILHCGCTEDGTAMAYEEISVSKNSKGHKNHVALSADSCMSGYDSDGFALFTDFVRTGDDCTLGGSLDGLTACAKFDVPPVELDECGAPLIQ